MHVRLLQWARAEVRQLVIEVVWTELSDWPDLFVINIVIFFILTHKSIQLLHNTKAIMKNTVKELGQKVTERQIKNKMIISTITHWHGSAREF